MNRMPRHQIVGLVLLLLFGVNSWVGAVNYTVLKKPQIRKSALQQTTKTIPSAVVAQFLTSLKVVGPEALAQSPYVIGFADEHIIAATGDRIYAKFIAMPANLNYTIYRKGTVYTSPKNNEILAYEAKYIADARLEKAASLATLTITRARHEVMLGDRLMVSGNSEIPLSYFPHPPQQGIKGRIIGTPNAVVQIGQHDVVVVDQGQIDGLEAGHTLAVYRDGKWVADPHPKGQNASTKLPDQQLGVLMVFRSFARVSYALVLEAKRQLRLFDKIQTPD